MKRTDVTTRTAQVMLLGVLFSGVAGCNHEITGQVVTLSGAYLGDMVTVLTTGYLHDALGIEDSGVTDDHADDDEHSHEAEPLHDHEH